MADNKYIYPDGERWVVRCKDFDVGAKIFGFSKYGNKELARKEAVIYRDQQIAKHHTIALLEPQKPPQPKAMPVKEKEPTDEEVAKRWSKFVSPNAEYGPEYIKRLAPSVQASIQHSKEGLQMNGEECEAYHYTGAWDVAFPPSTPGNSTWRPPVWDYNKEVILTNWVKEQLLKLRERKLDFTEPWINSWFAKQNLIQ